MNKHFDFCSAPLCVDGDNGSAVWYPGEEICIKVPKKKYQVRQEWINRAVKKGEWKKMEWAFTEHDLESGHI